jgi:hypothetical protein
VKSVTSAQQFVNLRGDQLIREERNNLSESAIVAAATTTSVI